MEEAATQVELSVSCRSLVNISMMTSPSPVCVLMIQHPGTVEWKEFGRSEVILNCNDPDFVSKFVLDYHFSESLKMKFEVYHISNSSSVNLLDQTFVGSMQCSLGEIVKNVKLTRLLNGPYKQCGEIIVSFEELGVNEDAVTLQFRAEKLDKKKLMALSDPFMVISRVNADKTFTVVHKTETIMRTLDPEWKQFSLLLSALCNLDHDRQLRFEVYDWNKSGKHELIGEFYSTLGELSRGPCPDNVFACTKSTGRGAGSKSVNAGTVKLVKCEISSSFSFLDYIRSGTEIQCLIAVDFSSLNRENPPKKHVPQADGGEQPVGLYAQALRAVGQTIQDYDSDKKLPAIGFSCKAPPSFAPSNLYHLNGNVKNSECDGIDGVMSAYYRAVKVLKPHSPTSFAPVINYAAKMAMDGAGKLGENYFILLIVTDGSISDLQQTRQAIVKAACLPLSIIIVGIGDGDFTDMNELDGDDIRVSYNGVEAERDIVQFVPYRDFLDNGSNVTLEQRMQDLTKAVLDEVPGQLLSFMRANCITPKEE